MIVIPHPFPPGVRALAGPAVRALQTPAGEESGLSRKYDEEASREGKLDGGMLILPTSGRVDRSLELLDVCGCAGDSKELYEGPWPLMAGVGASGRRSGSIGFQESFKAPRVPFVTAVDSTFEPLRMAFSLAGASNSEKNVVPGGYTFGDPMMSANRSELAGA